MAGPTVVKDQGNQFSQYSDLTNGRLVSSSACFPWNMTLKYKMKLTEGSWDKILRSKLKTQCFWKEEKKISGSLSLKVIDQVPGVVFVTSL